MSKIYFVGDVHLQEQSPISRKDSYPTSILNKLTEIGNLVRENNIEAVIFSGDISSCILCNSSFANNFNFLAELLPNKLAAALIAKLRNPEIFIK